MDLDLPVLDIVEDVAEVMNDEPPPNKVISEEEHLKLMEEEEEKKQPFVRKTATKKKKELSEKQIAHLNKIRGMALEKRKAKAAAKKEAVDKVKAQVSEDHKPKYYKPKPKKTPEEKALEREAKKKYKKQTMEVEENNIQSVVEEKTPDDFVPSHKADIKEKKEKQLFNQQDSFNHFMGNMETYMKMRDDYDQNNQRKKKPVTTKSPIHSKEYKQSKPIPIPNKQPQIPTILQPIEENPFSNYFG